MIEERVMGPKGQIVIPKTIREQLGLKRGSRVLFDFENGELILRSQQDPKKFVEEFCSAVKKKLKKRISLDELYTIQIDERILR